MSLPQNFTEIQSYRPARLHTGNVWYVSYYSYKPDEKCLKIKRVKINFIQKKSERRKYADELIKHINPNHEKGWNPWIESESRKLYALLKDAMDHFRNYSHKKFSDGDIGEDTLINYLSYLRILER